MSENIFLYLDRSSQWRVHSLKKGPAPQIHVPANSFESSRFVSYLQADRIIFFIMHYSSSILLIGAIAPLAIATPVPHFRLPFRRSTGDVRPFDGAIERDWNGTLDLPSAEIPKKSTVETPPIVLHKTLDEAHPYFAFLRKLVKRNSHHVISLHATEDLADSPETAKAPVPIPLAIPPPGTQPPPAGPPLGAAPNAPARAASESISSLTPEDEKRQIQYAPPSSWSSDSGVGGASPSAEEAEDERFRQEGPEANQMPSGHPTPEKAPLPQDGEVDSFPLVGAKRAASMSAEQLRQFVRSKTITTAKDVEEMKQLVGEVDLAEKQEQQSSQPSSSSEQPESAPEEPRLIKRNNKFAGSDIVTPEEASQAWKQTIRSSKSARGKLEIKGMETWVHENPFGKRDAHDEKMEAQYGMGDEHEEPSARGMMLRFGKRELDVEERDVAKSHLEKGSEGSAKAVEVLEPPVVEVVEEVVGAPASDPPASDAPASKETEPEVAVKTTTKEDAKANGPYGRGGGNYYLNGGGNLYPNGAGNFYPNEIPNRGGNYPNGGRNYPNGGGFYPNGGGGTYYTNGYNGGGRGYGDGRQYRKVKV